MDIPMVVSKWSPIKEDSQAELKTMPIWVTLKKVVFSWKGIGFLASAVGEPKRLHSETEQCTNFEEAKVFVEADLSKELPKTHNFRIKNEEEAEVEFVYPWLPPRCRSCMKWGHLLDTCVLTNGKRILRKQSMGNDVQLQEEGRKEEKKIINEIIGLTEMLTADNESEQPSNLSNMIKPSIGSR